jgi:hypothetical protein
MAPIDKRSGKKLTTLSALTAAALAAPIALEPAAASVPAADKPFAATADRLTQGAALGERLAAKKRTVTERSPKKSVAKKKKS